MSELYLMIAVIAVLLAGAVGYYLGFNDSNGYKKKLERAELLSRAGWRCRYLSEPGEESLWDRPNGATRYLSSVIVSEPEPKPYKPGQWMK